MGWSDDLNKIIKRDKLSAEKFIKASVIQAANVAIVRSPVGNPDLWVWNHPDLGYVDYVAWKGYPKGYAGGSFRSNWRVTLNGDDYAVKDIVSESQVKVEVANDVLRFTLGDTITFSNPLPYGPRLEYDGWSTQAPDGMVRPAVIALKKALNKEANK